MSLTYKVDLKFVTVITLPNLSQVWEYENNFYLSCDSLRIAKLIAHYEFYKLVKNIPGAIVECGVFKGASLCRFAMFREIFQNQEKQIIGFDTFSKFPKTNFNFKSNAKNPSLLKSDEEGRKKHMKISPESISKNQLLKILKHKHINKNINLIQGDIVKTVPHYVKNNPDLKISLLNLDVDIYEPSKTVLENFYSKISDGGILLLDDYGKFPGETMAVNNFFKDKKIKIKKLPYTEFPKYIVK